jgi:aryl-alcohol dehydrogenase-like predicted oxidoreductase
LGGGYGTNRSRYDVLQAIDAGLRAGFNAIDTAQGYGAGAGELMLARILGQHVRRDLFIISKFGIHYLDSTHPLARDASSMRARMSLEQTLWNLNTDYVDAYMVHWADPSTPMEDVAQGLATARASGKTRYIGVCNFSLDQLEALHRHVKIDLVQYPYSIVDRRIDTQGIVAWARSTGVAVVSYGSLGFGSLLAKAGNEWPAGDWRRDRPNHFGLGLFQPTRLEAIRRCGFSIQEIKSWLAEQVSSCLPLIGFQHGREVEEFIAAPRVTVNWSAIDRLLAANGVDPAPSTWVDELTGYELPPSHSAHRDLPVAERGMARRKAVQ